VCENRNSRSLLLPCGHNRSGILRACDFFDFPRFFHAQPTVVLKLPQGRHPERSASQIYRLTEGSWRAVEGPRRCLLADALHSFPATKIMKEIKKVTASDRSVPGFPTTRQSSTTTCAAFRRESRIHFANATSLNRKSGGAQWSCCFFSPSRTLELLLSCPVQTFSAACLADGALPGQRQRNHAHLFCLAGHVVHHQPAFEQVISLLVAAAGGPAHDRSLKGEPHPVNLARGES
jgi:hypothetical protein